MWPTLEVQSQVLRAELEKGGHRLDLRDMHGTQAAQQPLFNHHDPSGDRSLVFALVKPDRAAGIVCAVTAL